MMMKPDSSTFNNMATCGGRDGCGEAAVCQSMSSFLCVTDAPNDVINHDTTPFVWITGVRDQGEKRIG